MPKYRVRRHAVTQPLDKSYKLIPLTRNQNALVDTEDFARLSQWNWCALWSTHAKSFYAVRSENPMVYMHRIILDCAMDEDGDHRNHDTLDNRRRNLRKCSPTQNKQNSRPHKDGSGFKGVCWNNQRNKWQAGIQARGKRHHIGLFVSATEAAVAYDEAAKRLHGEFAHLNFPTS